LENDPDGDALVWFDGRRTDPANAALMNGTFAHHAELDDGNPRASLHGGVTVIPAALAVAETVGATGVELLSAIAAGYAAAVACGRPLLPGIVRHRLHPPSMVGCFGAAAAAGRLLGLSGSELTGAVYLAGTLMPLGPFESFTKGAPVKDLYGGYPAFIGVEAAFFARSGIVGPEALFESERDGIGAFLADGAHEARAPLELDLDEVLHVELKPWASCRSVHASLTALEKLLPLEKDVAEIHVETYRFAAELSAESDPSTPIGAKASIPYAIETLTGKSADVTIAEDVGPRGARVSVRFEDGTERTAEVSSPRSEKDARKKIRRLAGNRAAVLEAAVDELPNAKNLNALTRALRDATSSPDAFHQ